MATKKTTSDRVTITLPRARAGEPQDMLVGINGNNYLIPRGKPCEVPVEVAEEIERARRAEDYMYDQSEVMEAKA